MVALDPWGYLITIPVGGSPGYDRGIQMDSERTILAMRHGHFEVRRRKLGRKGTWWEMQRCLVDASDRSNGLMDFEIWVWR
jgi:hypothetical protein